MSGLQVEPDALLFNFPITFCVQDLATQRDENFRGGYSLPDVPLGVIRDVHEKCGHGGGKILSANGARLVQSFRLSAQLQDSSGTVF
jgi:hypothetical protein